jgi:hypothetical protein
MKTIKFRQPIFRNGEFYDWHYWGFLQTGGFTSPVEVEQHRSQESTGRLDNNGKEIYEGDIYAMLFPNGEWGSPEVVTWNNELCGFNLFPNEIREVLGNIYENPDFIIKHPDPTR